MDATRLLFAAAAASASAAVPAGAAEVWAGVYAHDIEDGLSEGGIERGPQLAAGVIAAPLEALSILGRPSPFLTGAVNTQGGTSYASVGLSWRVPMGARAYLRPALGLGVHDGEIDLPSPYVVGLADVTRQQRFARGQEELDLGSRVLAHLEFAIGWRASNQISIEASWMHLSHGGSAGESNPGLSDLGLRLVYTPKGR